MSKVRKAWKKGALSEREAVWRAYLAVGVLATCAYFVMPSGVQNVFYWFFGPLAIGGILAGIRLHRPRRRALWYVFLLGQVCSLVADVVFFGFPLFSGDKLPFPSVADPFYIGSYLLIAAGILLAIRNRAEGRDRSALIDAAIVVVSFGVPAWILLVEPYTRSHSLSLAERLTSISYPLAALLVFAVAVRLMTSHRERAAAYQLLLASVLSLVIGNVAYAVATLEGLYQPGGLVDAGWLLSYVFLGSAALHPSMRSLSEPAPSVERRTITWRRLLLLTGAALAAPAMIFSQEIFDYRRGDMTLIGGAAALVIVFALLRMEGLVRRLNAASLKYERAARREEVLRRAGTSLVAPPDQERIYSAALDAVLPFIEDALGTRVSIWSGSAEKDLCVGASGHRASEIEGRETFIAKFPDRVRLPLLEGRTVRLRSGESIEFREAFGFSTKTGEIFMVPLMVRGRFVGRIVVASDSPLIGDITYALEIVGYQVSLALERIELAGEVYRRRSEKRFQTLVQNASDIIAILDADGTFNYISSSVERTLGHRPGTWRARTPSNTSTRTIWIAYSPPLPIW